MMRSTIGVAVLCSMAGLAFSSASQAAVLYSFETTKASGGGFDVNHVTTAAAANVSGPTSAELSAGDNGLERFHNDQWAGFTLIGTVGTSPDFATAYFEFTVTADPGYTLDLTSLDFGSARGGTSGGRGFELYGAVNGAAFNQATDLLLDIDAETGTRAAPVDRSVDLTGAIFQGIESITFRYYPLTTASTRSVDFTGMELNGTVVPEPAAGLLGLTCLMPLARRRRRT